MPDPTDSDETRGSGARATVFDRAAALRNVGGDPEILRQLVELFLDQGWERVDRVSRALSEGNARELEIAAHSLKGTAALMGMTRLRDRAYSLERSGAEGTVDAAGPDAEGLRAAMGEALEALRAELAS